MENWSIKNHVKGDTFNQRKLTFPFDITDCIFKMQFRISEKGSVAFEWTTINNTFEKISSTELIMKSRILDVPALSYFSDFEATFLDGTVRTLFRADLKILQDITHG